MTPPGRPWFDGECRMGLERLLPPPQDCTGLRSVLPRAFLAGLFASVGCNAGLGYVHMCEAGSRLVEWGAVLGTPLAVGALVLFPRRLWSGMLGAALVILAVYAFCGPYLDWAHGR
jgi:hypothetical protein